MPGWFHPGVCPTKRRRNHTIQWLRHLVSDDNEGNLVLMVVNKDRKDYQTKIQLSGYPGKAVDNTFYYVFKRYSLTCIKLPKDIAKNQGDVWVYGEEQINTRRVNPDSH